jgi:hypothetical protein
MKKISIKHILQFFLIFAVFASANLYAMSQKNLEDIKISLNKLYARESSYIDFYQNLIQVQKFESLINNLDIHIQNRNSIEKLIKNYDITLDKFENEGNWMFIDISKNIEKNAYICEKILQNEKDLERFYRDIKDQFRDIQKIEYLIASIYIDNYAILINNVKTVCSYYIK